LQREVLWYLARPTCTCTGQHNPASGKSILPTRQRTRRTLRLMLLPWAPVRASCAVSVSSAFTDRFRRSVREMRRLICAGSFTLTARLVPTPVTSKLPLYPGSPATNSSE